MCGFWTICSRFLVVVLCLLVAVQPVLAQQGLRIELVEGGSDRNVVQQIAARPLTVRVVDAAGRPLPDVPVTFASPQTGPSGEFTNGERTLIVTTDSRGIASAERYHPNASVGTYNIEVKAEFQNQMASLLIPQQNVNKGKGRGKLFAIIAIAGAAAAAIAVSSLKKNGGGSGSTTTPPTITPGGSTVGGPPTP
jgi:hypothetical protein